MIYRIEKCNRDSSHYGNCEVCNKPVTSVFKQQKKYRESSKVWITGLFGHQECLSSCIRFSNTTEEDLMTE